MDHYGVVSLIPALSVIIIAIISRRTFESLLFGAIIGFIILEKWNFFPAFLDAVYKVFSESGTAWLILVCGLFGSLIALVERSGGAKGFSALALKFTKSRKASMFYTWVLGIVIFADDYLNALAVGSAMRKVTDAFKVSREMLAYIINSTGTVICVLIPFSTWSAFIAGQLEVNGVTAHGTGTGAYISSIPYNLYAWCAVLIVPLIILKIMPIYGPLKQAELRAINTGEVFPASMKEKAQQIEEAEEALTVQPKVFNFLIPMIGLAVITIYTMDMLVGVIIAIFICAVLYFPQRLMTFGEFWDAFMDGLKDMIPVLSLVVASFFLREANDALGLTPYVIETVKPIMSGALLPVVTFLTMGAIAFATGTFWGLIAIALPIIIPLAEAMGVNVFLAIGAVTSAGALGSHACFYGDAPTLTCSSTQITNIDYARTSLPMIITPIVLASILYIVLGYAMG
ncbi:MAG TPA: sodium:proton antiporter [Firmicutes bacterium]|nr:sodium:proton antiporter [Bacillota bacterium]